MSSGILNALKQPLDKYLWCHTHFNLILKSNNFANFLFLDLLNLAHMHHRLLLQVIANSAHPHPLGHVLLHLPRAISLQVFHASTENTASSFWIETFGVVRTSLNLKMNVL